MNKNIFKFKLLILDIDGILTDGKKSYDYKGKVTNKSFCDLDFTAIKRFKEKNIEVCLLSSDKNINKAIAKKRGLKFFYSRDKNNNIIKEKFVPKFEKLYKLNRSQMAYVGDDFYDLKIIKTLNKTFCPSNSPKIIKKNVSHVLIGRSGEYLISELYDLCFKL
tara:strand:+ start:851 stop:1339 length:489 start_codon:yes stop_codon:yes gene_type:complete